MPFLVAFEENVQLPCAKITNQSVADFSKHPAKGIKYEFCGAIEFQ